MWRLALFLVFMSGTILFSNVIALLGKRELVYMLLVHMFVNFVCVTFCLFSLPFLCYCWLRIAIVALPGHFI